MAAPVISCTPSRTSGTAPLGVVFDATGTTDADTTKPFHDLLYQWSFGDLAAGNWTTGANPGASKNGAFGAVAGHVYERAGTYTWVLLVSDGTTVSRTSGTITVVDPDVTFAGTATVCVSTSGDFTGAPTGATQVTNSDFDAVIATHMGTGKRVLFRRGETFVSSTAATVSSAGPNTIGAYGSGALPIISCISAAHCVTVNNAAVNDLRIMDLNFVGIGAGHVNAAINFTAAVTNVTIFRNTITDVGTGVTLQTGTSLTGSILQENTIANYSGNAFFGYVATTAYLGNALGPTRVTGEHVLRIQRWQRVAVSHNTIHSPAPTKEALTMRAEVHVTAAEDSFYGVVSHNRIMAGEHPSTVVQFAPSADASDEWIYDTVFEYNWIQSGKLTQKGLRLAGARITARNNVFNMNGALGHVPIMVNTAAGAALTLPMDDNQMLNNTAFTSDTGSDFRLVRLGPFGETITNTVIKNNLGYAPNDSIHALHSQGAGTSGTIGASGTFGNSSDAQIGATDPSFASATPLNPIDYRISTGSYAATSGVALFPSSNDDFFHGDDSTANEHSGAFIPRTRSRCKGVA